MSNILKIRLLRAEFSTWMDGQSKNHDKDNGWFSQF